MAALAVTAGTCGISGDRHRRGKVRQKRNHGRAWEEQSPETRARGWQDKALLQLLLLRAVLAPRDCGCYGGFGFRLGLGQILHRIF